MTKHIIIAGVPRAGKSTVSQMIAKKFGYQHISMDSVIAGFEKAFPQVGIDTDADMDVKENVKSISAKIAPFLRAMMDSGEYDECDYGMVIDVFQLLPEDYRKHIEPEVCEIYYFVTSDVTAKERFELLKKYDTPKDYTYYKPDEEKSKDCVEIVELSKYYREQCERYELRCFETARDREQVLSELVNVL